MKKEQIIHGFKGYDKNLKCRNFQYEIGGEYDEPDAAICESGFHFCRNPLDVWSYYPITESRFTEVDGSGKSATHDEDSKVSCSHIKIGAEVNLKTMISAGIKFIFESTKSSKETKATTGDRANAAPPIL